MLRDKNIVNNFSHFFYRGKNQYERMEVLIKMCWLLNKNMLILAKGVMYLFH